MQRYSHNLNHHHNTTTEMGKLVPVMCTEVIPGDSFRHSSAVLLRTQPLVAPVMHPVQVRLHTFYVPCRIIWDDWEDFITEKDPALVVPTVNVDTTNDDTYALFDHLGIPPVNGLAVNALPIRAYNLIWNEFYRDQDLETELDITTSTALQRCAWEKDYLTTARDTPQQGDEAVIGFEPGAQTTVQGLAYSSTTATPGAHRDEDGNTVTLSGTEEWRTLSTKATNSTSGAGPVEFPFVDLSASSTGISVNEMRRAFALQRFAEARARYGSRYVDYLRWLGIRPADGRLDRPEYLGGGKSYISFSEVLATAEGASTVVGDLSGHGITALRTRAWRAFFQEHGYLITVASVRPKTMYQDGLMRKWFRSDSNDFWKRELEILPTQEVFNKEVKADHATPDGIFGYSNRFQEYRYEPSYVSGEFRDPAADFWHLSRQFATDPALNDTFVSCVPDDRIFASANDPDLYLSIGHYLTAMRLIRKHAA